MRILSYVVIFMMMVILSVIFVFVIIAIACRGEDQVSVTKFDHYVKTPTSLLHTGGRITDRQIGYISQAGYKSILSIAEFTTNDTSYNGVAGTWPSSEYEVSIAASYGLNAKYLATTLSPESVTAVVEIIDSLAKPIYVHCHVKFPTSFFYVLCSHCS